MHRKTSKYSECMLLNKVSSKWHIKLVVFIKWQWHIDYSEAIQTWIAHLCGCF